MATLNIGLKVNRAIGGATTVNANAYAMVDYLPSGTWSPGGGQSAAAAAPPMTRHFGPGQLVPASFNISIPQLTNGSAGSQNITYTLASGVELINTQ